MGTRRRLGRALLPLGLVSLAVGISTAVVVPFLSLFLSTAVHAGPVRVTVFLIVAPLAGVVASTLIGRLSDRRPIRRALLVGTSVAGLVGMALTAFVRDYWILLALTVTATALAGALFPQTFAYARQVLARDGSDRAAMGITTLRTVFSLAWVAGPPLAAFLLDAGGFAYVYGMAAAMYAVAGLVAIFWLSEIEAPAAPAASCDESDPDAPDAREAHEASRWTLLLTTAAFTLLQCPLTLGLQALPLFISTDLGGDAGDAGLILGLCAALEIPLMLGLGALTTRIRLRTLVLAGAGCGVAYNVLATVASEVWTLAVAQIVNAAFIAAVTSLGISYMQDMLPRQPGRATTLFTNSYTIGAILAGPLLGLAQHFGYRLAYGMGTGLCATGLLMLLTTRPGSRSRSPRSGLRARASRFRP
ncbi:sugar efflux transporter [Actinomadura sp. HBU206391]|uniref:sugar efflux transporter n=1 Tax=Actinomadura sp. HBU206391 TaxID=2731692 RepID=UPI00164EFF5F|nr:sugar efflux transporter [Actinomadura sp. HBU206391]MBC6456674.1 sugar efflux transporter [Actinomadura sp. HBU206391]